MKKLLFNYVDFSQKLSIGDLISANREDFYQSMQEKICE